MMSEFKAESVAILGRQPDIGLAELEAIYGSRHLQPIEGAVLLDIPAAEINFKRLGGTVKVAQKLAEIPSTNWSEIEKFLILEVPGYLKSKEGRFTLGISAYGIDVRPDEIVKTGLSIKKAAGRSMRIVPNKAPALNSAQVLHNKLTGKGSWELVLIRHGSTTWLAQTFFVQDIEDYAARDQVRPKRDARVGMLPPKLAQVLVNLTVGALPNNDPDRWDKGDGDKRVVLLDSFCGTGVILQEALLMGFSVYGSDIDPRMVEYSKENLRWLVSQHPGIEGRVVVETGDATSYQWPGFSALASEVYLGRPLSELPASTTLEKIVQDTNTIAKKFLRNLHPQLKSKRRAALAIPAWQVSPGRFKHLPVIDQLTEMGYNVVKFKHVGHTRLVYFRPEQIVARELVVITKE